MKNLTDRRSISDSQVMPFIVSFLLFVSVGIMGRLAMCYLTNTDPYDYHLEEQERIAMRRY
jgi:hypothetical protein